MRRREQQCVRGFPAPACRWCEGAGGRPRAAAEHGGHTLISDSSICCGQMKWMWLSMPPAVTIMPSAAMIFGARADDDVDTRLHVRVARLADLRDASAAQTDVGLDDAPVVDDERSW